MDSIQGKLGGLLGGRKFLIVLDDLWNEDRDKWLGLRKFLMVGGIGSRVLVTTRSETTAIVVDGGYKYELKGLSPENSWRLFEMTAFGEKGKDTHNMNYSESVKLGKQIVEKCSNVPLAIRVVGTLLYGQSESKWRFIQECGLASLNSGENKIMSILKLSYDNLDFPLKACFTYCSLFPKDYRIEKEKLIRLWMAQGYIVPFDVGQSLEEAAEEYFSILLRRCFFQDVVTDDIRGVVSFQIHDLIHDLAQKVAGKDVASLNSTVSDLREDAHHIFHVGSKCEGNFFPKCKIRSYVRDDIEINFPVIVNLVESWKFLRTLDLHSLEIQTLPDSIGKLLHLRFLDLSHNMSLVRLPNTVTKLYNLQTLDLQYCYSLKELPKDLAKLVNLRHLDIYACGQLSHMPPGLDKLSCLCVLTEFVVGKESSGCLESLQGLTNLRGRIRIRTTGKFRHATEEIKVVEGYLSKMKRLEKVALDFSNHENHESLLEKLEPPSNVKALELRGYNHTTLPAKWRRGESNFGIFLPNLVRLEIYDCSNLVHLPALSKLRHLKSLSLWRLRKLEYVENIAHETDAFTFFPLLEYLDLKFLPNLKGWWKRDGVNGNDWQPSLIKLSTLSVFHCGKLASFPTCPILETLTLIGVKELKMSVGKEEGLIKLTGVTLDKLDYLQSLPTQSLTTLCVSRNNELKSFSEHEEMLFNGCFSLRSLQITCCNSLMSLNGECWKHLTSLESLLLGNLPKLTFSRRQSDTDDNNNEDNDEIPWRSLDRNLRSLKFFKMGVKILPKGMRHLKSLQNLELKWCKNLECLPDWICYLSSLQSLCIVDCPMLNSFPGQVRDLTSLQLLDVSRCPVIAERYHDPGSDEWRNLRHISTVNIRAD